MKAKFLSAILFGSCLVSLGTTAPVRAEWEYTRWGMTVAEVRAASGGRATPVAAEDKPPSGDGTQTLLRDRWQFDGYSFEVLLNFAGEEPKLSEVVLTSNDPNERMGQSFRTKFGLPTKAEGSISSEGTDSDRSFALIDKDEATASPGDPSGQTTRMTRPPETVTRVTLEWVTNTDFIQLQRQEPTGATLVFQPLKPEQETLKDASIVGIAETFIDLVMAGDFEKARQSLYPTLKAEWTPEVMEEKLNKFENRVGPYQRRLDSRVVENVVFVTTEFGNVTDDLLFIFNNDKQIVGIDFPQQDVDFLVN